MRIRVVAPLLGASLLALTAGAQSTPPAPAPAAQKSLAATLNVYVFPSGGQSASQQSKDEGECYQWAVNNTGSDPFEMQKQEAAAQQQAQQKEQQVAEAGKGAGAKGAVRGAAAGALIGEIASDDAGEGAAYGAAAGVIAARFGREAIYMYGGSSSEHRAHGAAFMLQFEAMRWARGAGSQIYDLWGIPSQDPESTGLEGGRVAGSKGDDWRGLYKFKVGFGGDIVRYPPAIERRYHPFLAAAARRVAGRD